MNNKENEILHYKNTIVENINRIVYNKHWSIKQLSDKSNLPYESVKKIVNGKINNPTIYSLAKISKALDCSLDYILDKKNMHSINTDGLPQHASNLLSEIVDLETYLHHHNQIHNTNFISVLVLNGRSFNGMVYDDIYVDSVDISEYRSKYGDIIMCGLKICDKGPNPYIFNNKTLLIAQDRFPLNKEIGVFFLGNKIYIRRYISESTSMLLPLTEEENPITIQNIDDWHFFGRVLTVIKN